MKLSSSSIFLNRALCPTICRTPAKALSLFGTSLLRAFNAQFTSANLSMTEKKPLMQSVAQSVTKINALQASGAGQR